MTAKFKTKTIIKELERSAMARLPAEQIRWRDVDSSNVMKVGWDSTNTMYVRFQNDVTYLYRGVTRQRAVAMSRAASVGKYLNSKIKPNFEAVRIN